MEYLLTRAAVDLVRGPRVWNAEFEEDWALWFLRCLSVEQTLTFVYHSFMKLLIHKCPGQLGSHTWLLPFTFNLVFHSLFPLECYGGDSTAVRDFLSLSRGTLVPDHNTKEGVWQVPVIVPPSPLRALVVGIKSASSDLLVFQPL